MSARTIVCRCEDVTQSDIEEAIAKGFSEMEEVKRYTGFGTGPCQGKECLVHVARLLLAQTSIQAAQIPAFTARPPLHPLPLAHLAANQPKDLLTPIHQHLKDNE